MFESPDAVILCGGAGLRLRSVTGNAPKSMASVADRPFLDFLFAQLRRYRFRRAILAVGFEPESIRSHFGTDAHGLLLSYSSEPAPLGTGGALRNALEQIETDTLLAMNGDSYTDADLAAFLAQHHSVKAEVSMIVVPGAGRADCGAVVSDSSGRVRAFQEKPGPELISAYVNAGIYAVSKRLLETVPPGVPLSLERELIPRWISEKVRVHSFTHSGACTDIGTPERYRAAQTVLGSLDKDLAPVL